MKRTVKYAVAGACALAASSTATLAQEIPAGFTAGIDLASPLPTGIYAFDINGIINSDHGATPSIHGNFYATVPGLIWSSPYEIAGGKLGMTGYVAYGDFEHDTGGFPGGVFIDHASYAGPWIAQVEGNIKWNFGALSVSENAGLLYLFGSGDFFTARVNGYKDNTNFEGMTDFAWKGIPGLEALLNVKYGNANLLGTDNNGWLTLEGALLKKFGKMAIGPLLVYSTNLSGPDYDQTLVGAKVSYDFDGFSANFRVMQTVEYSGTLTGNDTRVFVDFIKPLWVAEGPLPLK